MFTIPNIQEKFLYLFIPTLIIILHLYIYAAIISAVIDNLSVQYAD